MNLFEVIKKNIRILSISKDSVTIGTEKGFWSKGLKFGDKRRLKMNIGERLERKKRYKK